MKHALVNQARNKNNWLLIDLRGNTSNRDGIGASLKLTAVSCRVLYNHATTSIGLMPSGHRRVHFGFGDETTVRSIEIRWPSGIVQHIGQVTANQILKVNESSQ